MEGRLIVLRSGSSGRIYSRIGGSRGGGSSRTPEDALLFTFSLYLTAPADHSSISIIVCPSNSKEERGPRTTNSKATDLQ